MVNGTFFPRHRTGNEFCWLHVIKQRSSMEIPLLTQYMTLSYVPSRQQLFSHQLGSKQSRLNLPLSVLSNVLAWTISSLYQSQSYDPPIGRMRPRASHVCTVSTGRTTYKSIYQELYVRIIIGAYFIPQGIVRAIERSFIITCVNISCFFGVCGFAKYHSKSRLYKRLMTFSLNRDLRSTTYTP